MKKVCVAAAAIVMAVTGSAQAAEPTKRVYLRLDTGWGFAADAEIGYFDGGEIKWPANASGFTGVKGDLKSHEVALGLRYGF